MTDTPKVARLQPPIRKEGHRYTGRYSVGFDGEIIVVGSRDPEHDAALLAKGITRELTFVDAHTGKSRTIIDIEKAAKLTVTAESRDGLRIRRYRESPDSGAPTGEDDTIVPTMPPEANEAA